MLGKVLVLATLLSQLLPEYVYCDLVSWDAAQADIVVKVDKFEVFTRSTLPLQNIRSISFKGAPSSTLSK
jgi:hypothetical protein